MLSLQQLRDVFQMFNKRLRTKKASILSVQLSRHNDTIYKIKSIGKCNKSERVIFRETTAFLRILRFLLNVTQPRRNSRDSSKDLTFLQISAVAPPFCFSSCFQFVSLFFPFFVPILSSPPFLWPVKRRKAGPTRGPLRVVVVVIVVVVLQHSTSETSGRAHVLHFYAHARSLLHILFFPSVARDNRLPSEAFFHETLLPPSTRLFFLYSLPFFSLFLV